MFGREEERKALDSALAEAARGRLRVALIEGEAGIGKTALLEWARDAAAARGFTVFAAKADELERARPFGAIADALGIGAASKETARAEIRRLLTGESGPGGDRQWLIVERVLDLIEQEALDRPALLALDDAQWADPSTLIALASMRRRLAFVPIAVLAASRPTGRGDDSRRALDRLLDPDGIHVRLGPLDAGSVHRLLAATLGAEPGPGLLEQVTGAAGNPLFVTELAKALDAEGAVARADGRADVANQTLPPNVGMTILRRLSFLSEDTLEFLRHAALLGAEFASEEISAVLGRPVLDLRLPIEDAVRAGLLSADTERLRFRHDLIREALYGDVPLALRRRMHREAADRLTAVGAPMERVADQLLLGAEVGDVEAAKRLLEAGLVAGRSSAATGARILERAIDVCPPGPDRHRIAAALVPALFFAGRLADSEARALQTLSEGPQAAIELQIRGTLGDVLTHTAPPDEQLDNVERQMAIPGLPDGERCGCFIARALAHLVAGDFDTAEAAMNEAVEIGRRLYPAEWRPLVNALRNAFFVENARSRHERAIEVCAEAVSICRTHMDPGSPPGEFLLALALSNHSLALLGADRFAEAEHATDEACHMFDSRGDVFGFARASMTHQMIHEATGYWDDAVRVADTRIAVMEDSGMPTYPNLQLAYIFLHRGELGRAKRCLAALAPEIRAPFIAATPVIAGTIAAFIRAASDPRAAAESIRKICHEHPARLWALYAPQECVRLLASAGMEADGEAIASALETRTSAGGTASARGIALHCRGLVEDDPAILLEAVKLLRGTPRDVSRAFACEDAATAAGRAGNLGDAEALFTEALEIYGRMGALRDIRSALASMRSVGIRRGARAPRRRPTSGWESLTPTETEVVRLAAEHLTNPEIGERLFISKRTVQTHLQHVFGKLGISSRAELRALASEHAS